MRSYWIIGALAVSACHTAWAMESVPVKNNADFELLLSQSNYNRLLVKDDKILDVAFPQQAMGIKRDEQDGSLYIALADTKPFTLFLSTAAGRHFSVTVRGETSLGKTIELIPTTAVPAQSNHNISEEKMLRTLISHMETHQALPGFSITNQQQVEHWKKGLTLTHQQLWQGKQWMGEVIELLNRGKVALNLQEAWFNQDTTRALKLSQKQLAPQEKAFLYRVADLTLEMHHG
jgi:conjugal transfer pilus assembly protein TraK